VNPTLVFSAKFSSFRMTSWYRLVSQFEMVFLGFKSRYFWGQN
jgi:hypothetical protein